MARHTEVRYESDRKAGHHIADAGMIDLARNDLFRIRNTKTHEIHAQRKAEMHQLIVNIGVILCRNFRSEKPGAKKQE